MTDQERFARTLLAARGGEAWALEELYRALAPAVVGYLRGQGAREPEDAASETFVAMVRRLPDFEGDERAFRSWIFSIAHRRLLDERRRAARRREHSVDPAALRGTGALARDAADEALDRIGSERALRALDSLTPEQRDVLLLRVLGGLSGAEAAEVLEKSEGAVKASLRRGLRALARQFEGEKIR